jgi:hypothetical protein
MLNARLQDIKQKLNDLTEEEFLELSQSLSDYAENSGVQSSDVSPRSQLLRDTLKVSAIKAIEESLTQVSSAESITKLPEPKAAAEKLELDPSAAALGTWWSSLNTLLPPASKFDRLFVLTYGGIAIGTFIGQIPGAIIGGSLGMAYGLYTALSHDHSDNTINSKDD